MYTIKGELKAIGTTEQVSYKFKKREFVVVEPNEKYPQSILFQAVQDRCEVLDKFKVGDSVEVTFFLKGREWLNPKDNTVRYFNSLDAWKVEPISTMGTTTQPNKQHETFVDEDSDLPF